MFSVTLGNIGSRSRNAHFKFFKFFNFKKFEFIPVFHTPGYVGKAVLFFMGARKSSNAGGVTKDGLCASG